MKRSLLYFFLLLSFFANAQNKDSLLRVIKSNVPDSEKVRAMNTLSETTRRINIDEAISWSRKAVGLANQIHNKKGPHAQAYLDLGIALSWSGEFDSACVYIEKALPEFKALHDPLRQANCLTSLGNARAQQGNYGKALSCFFEALRIYTDLNDENRQGIVLSNIANTYGSMDDGSNAVKYYEQAIRIKEKKHDESSLIVTLNNLGGVYLDMGKIEEAEKSADKAQEYLTRLGDKNDSAYLFTLQGKIFLEKKQYPEALAKLNISLQLCEDMGDEPEAVTNILEIGLVYATMNDTAKANAYIEQGFQRLRAMKDLPLIEDAYEAVADRYADIGQPQVSYHLLKKLLSLQDTLHSQQLNELIAKKEAGYQNEKKQHELDVANKNSKIAALELDRTKFLVALLVVIVIIVLLGAGFLFNRNRLKQQANDQLERHNLEITTQKKAITDSIDYAKKIQDSILPPESQIRQVLPNSFILYEPKDVVSGDFYWLDSRDGLSIFAAVDCTGHGVPGALMSVIGFNLLNQAVNEMGLTKPSEILHHLDYGVNKLLRQSDEANSVKDGMDIALCTYDAKTRKLQYAGVFNPAYLISKGEFVQLKPDKFPIGINVDGVADDYTNTEYQLFPGDMIYLFSDGYADQFGGKTGKKYKYTRFRELLIEIHDKDCAAQKEMLHREFIDWKGPLEQVDDILVIGVRVD